MADAELKAKLELVTSGKPGYKTTEFWKSLAVHVVALAVIAYGMQKGSDGIVQFGTILLGVASGSYTIGRSLAKGSLAKTAATLLSGVGKESKA